MKKLVDLKSVTEPLVRRFGQKYSEVLGISLEGGDDGEIFKWFLVSILFGAPIRESSTIKTYKCFKKYDVLTPQKIIQTRWQGLVDILDEGAYARYDFRTSDKLLQAISNLVTLYKGSLNNLHRLSSDSIDLEKRLKNLGKGIGDVTVSIFLRELRNLWEKANPKPTPLVVLAAKNLGIIKEETPEKALEALKEYWTRNKVSKKTFVNFETALLRLGKDFCRKKKCQKCAFQASCPATFFSA